MTSEASAAISLPPLKKTSISVAASSASAVRTISPPRPPRPGLRGGFRRADATQTLFNHQTPSRGFICIPSHIFCLMLAFVSQG